MCEDDGMNDGNDHYEHPDGWYIDYDTDTKDGNELE